MSKNGSYPKTYIQIAHDCDQFVLYYLHVVVVVRNSLPTSKSLVILHTDYADRHTFIHKDFLIQSMDNITFTVMKSLCSA
jgi:hypothetical protein